MTEEKNINRNFRVGDRVRVRNGCWYSSLKGEEGTVIGNAVPSSCVAPPNETVQVDFAKPNYEKWHLDPNDLQLIPTIPIITPLILPADATERKKVPLGTGVLDYFPAALAEIAKVSYAGNQQHNPGEPLHWARGKSTDQADTMLRHFLERGTLDSDGIRHSAKMCWRALAILQLELEAEGYPIARGAK